LLIKKQRPDLLKGKETPALMPSTKKLKEKLKRKKKYWRDVLYAETECKQEKGELS
jgi:hypothetical protein